MGRCLLFSHPILTGRRTTSKNDVFYRPSKQLSFDTEKERIRCFRTIWLSLTPSGLFRRLVGWTKELSQRVRSFGPVCSFAECLMERGLHIQSMVGLVRSQ